MRRTYAQKQKEAPSLREVALSTRLFIFSLVITPLISRDLYVDTVLCNTGPERGQSSDINDHSKGTKERQLTPFFLFFILWNKHVLICEITNYLVHYNWSTTNYHILGTRGFLHVSFRRVSSCQPNAELPFGSQSTSGERKINVTPSLGTATHTRNATDTQDPFTIP